MGTYILLGAAGGYISGAPIYHRNKALYMRQQGWDVYYISCCSGEIYVKGLEQFVIGVYSFLCMNAYLFPRKRQDKLIDVIIKQIPNVGKNVVIETGTYYTAYWGELLAKRLNAKHVIVYLDEYNDGITWREAVFFHFKFKRNELACISKKAMIEIFSPFWNVNEANAVELPCYCSNSLDDYKNDIEGLICRKDYNVGYIGRLEKPALKAVISALKDFVRLIGDKRVALICLGGAEECVVNEIKEMISNIPNVSLFISGYIYPIPLNAIKKCDIVFSSAGSAKVSVKAEIPTVKMNVYSNKPEGFLVKISPESLIKYSDEYEVIDYLKIFFIDNVMPAMSHYSLDDEKQRANVLLSLHVEFLKNTCKLKEYYDMSLIPLTLRQRTIRTLISCCGMRILPYIKSLIK